MYELLGFSEIIIRQSCKSVPLHRLSQTLIIAGCLNCRILLQELYHLQEEGIFLFYVCFPCDKQLLSYDIQLTFYMVCSYMELVHEIYVVTCNILGHFITFIVSIGHL